MSFNFKQFSVDDSRCAMKIGTDGVLLGAWADVSDVKQTLDIGTGSGLIALMVAQRNEASRVCALELDEAAAEDARMNVKASPWSERISVIQGDFSEYVPVEAPDLIVSNPPFFTESLTSPSDRRALARHAGGLSPQSLIDYAARALSQAGMLAMITPTRDESDILFSAEIARLCLRRLTRVKSSERKPVSRLLWQFSRTAGPVEENELIIRGEGGVYSEQYRALTRDFYLDF